MRYNFEYFRYDVRDCLERVSYVCSNWEKKIMIFFILNKVYSLQLARIRYSIDMPSYLLQTAWKGFIFIRVNREKALDYDRARKFKRYAIWYYTFKTYLFLHIYSRIHDKYSILCAPDILETQLLVTIAIRRKRDALSDSYQFSKFSSQNLRKAFNRYNRIDIIMFNRNEYPRFHSGGNKISLPCLRGD